jgi:hypothetical protein
VTGGTQLFIKTHQSSCPSLALIKRQVDMLSIFVNFAPSISIRFVTKLAFAAVLPFQTVVFSILILHSMGAFSRIIILLVARRMIEVDNFTCRRPSRAFLSTALLFLALE